ncbi:MAG TPA: hypothetical protein VJ487_08135 [Alphaproteobacteria bacterium]|nr:hypothetical protein [Alphaproteobacteria bacterium]
MPKRKEVAMSSRKAMSHDDASRTDRWVRDGDALWILYAVIGWAIAYLLYLSSSSTFQLGL